MLAIYNDVVLTSIDIFSDIARSEEDQRQWLHDRRAQDRPVIVACKEGDVAGFASYGSRKWRR